MVLPCPHCDANADYDRAAFFGHWVVCPACELPFAWREAGAEGEDAGKRRDSWMTKGRNPR